MHLCSASGSSCGCAFTLGFCFSVNGIACEGDTFCPCETLPEADCSGTQSCVSRDTGGGLGDPHFSGFDRSRFDFHGVHNRSYLLFSEKGRDLLAARMQSTPELYYGFNKTYFSEFGLHIQRTTSIYALLISLEKFGYQRWGMKVSLDGKIVKKDTQLPGLKCTFSRKGDEVHISSEQHKFTFNSVSTKSAFRKHLDFNVALLKAHKTSDSYAGILGMTLRRRLGDRLHSDVLGVKVNDHQKFETTMRRFYEVPSLFPGHESIASLYM